MNSEQAKAVLQHYRPTVDAQDPRFSAALEQVKRDPALAQWFTEHCASYEAIRRILRQTPVPAGLREEILQAYRRRPKAWWLRPALVAMAVVAAMVITVTGYSVYWQGSVVTQRRDFAAYVQAMTSLAAGSYTLAVATADGDVLRHYFATAHGHTDYVLTRGLRALRLEGGLVVDWFGHKVSMLCFDEEEKEPQDKQTNEDHEDHYVWFFVSGRDALPGAPASEAPRFALAHGLLTASWSHHDKTYVLATRGTLARLERLL